MQRFLKVLVVAGGLTLAVTSLAQSDVEGATPIPSPSIPAGPRPTATVTPLAASPEPTTAVTPLPSASLSGTQPQTTNTVTPSPTPEK